MQTHIDDLDRQMEEFFNDEMYECNELTEEEYRMEMEKEFQEEYEMEMKREMERDFKEEMERELQEDYEREQEEKRQRILKIFGGGDFKHPKTEWYSNSSEPLGLGLPTIHITRAFDD